MWGNALCVPHVGISFLETYSVHTFPVILLQGVKSSLKEE
ncbi:hypothetical protein WCP94_002964 [Bilophila wadsworthia]